MLFIFHVEIDVPKSNWPNLQSLSFGECKITSKSLSTISYHQLTSINFRGCRITDDCIIELANVCMLNEVVLDKCHALTDMAVVAVSTKCLLHKLVLVGSFTGTPIC
jgi:hypothetical protein